jgi:hypothetical protein
VPEVTFGGMPAWLLEEYLIELGGARTGNGAVAGDGWRAILTAAPTTPPAIARITVAIEGPRADDLMQQLRTKAQRGGG